MGKTYLAKKLTDFRTRVLVYDTVREFDKGNYVVVASIKELELQLEQQAFNVRFWDDFRNEETFNAVCELAYEFQDFIFVVDEVEQFTTLKYCPPGLKRLINLGRHKSIELISTSQTPSEIPTLLRSQVTDYYFLRMHEPAHLDYVRKIYDGNIEHVKNLNEQEHIHYIT